MNTQSTLIRQLEAQRENAEHNFAVALGSDKQYYAGLCAAYTLAIAMLAQQAQKEHAS